MSIGLLKFTLKRPKIILFSTLGILLATSFIFASFMVGDYVIGASLMKALDRIPADFIVNARGIWNKTGIIYGITNIEHVTACEPFIQWWASLNSTSENETYCIQMVFIPDLNNSSIFQRIYKISGRFPRNYNEIAISDDLATWLHLTINSTVNIQLGWNLTLVFKVVGIVSLEIKERYYFLPYQYYLLLNYNSWEKYLSELPENSPFSDFREYFEKQCYFAITVDHDAVVDPFDIGGSMAKVKSLETKISTEASKYCETAMVDSLLLYVLWSYSFRSFGIKLRFFIATFPILLMGWVLALMTNWVFINERRREIGLLKVRGARSKQIFVILFFEGILVGLLGGIIGGFISYFLANEFISISLVNLFGLNPSYVLTRIFSGYLYSSVILGVIFGVLAVLFPARGAAKLPIIQALSERVIEIEEKEWKPKWSWILIILGIYGVIEGITHQFIFINVLSAVIRSRNFFLFFVFFIFVFIEFFSVFVGPFFFMYFVAKFVAFYASKARKVFSAIVKPIAGIFYQVAIRNFARKPARTARIIFLLTLMFATIFIFSISTATSLQTNKISTQFSLGADIRVDIRFTSINTKSVNWSQIIDKILSINGVNAITRGKLIDYESMDSYSYIFYAVDATYFNSTFFKIEYFDSVRSDYLQSFSNGSKVAILSISGKKFYNYKIGDEIQGRIINNCTFKVIGFVKFLPGIAFWEDTQARMCVYIVIPYKLVENESPSVLFIDVEEDFNQTAIAEQVEKILDEHGIDAEVRTYRDELKRLEEESFVGALVSYFRIEYSIAIFMAAVGMVLIMTMSAIERRREIALLVARGVSRKHILSVFLAEGFLLTLISLLVAFVSGLGFAIVLSVPTSFTVDPITGDVIFYELPPGIGLVFGIDTVIFVFVSILVLSLISILPAYIISKQNIAEILRVHH